jgi:hypothetical protein
MAHGGKNNDCDNTDNHQAIVRRANVHDGSPARDIIIFATHQQKLKHFRLFKQSFLTLSSGLRWT